MISRFLIINESPRNMQIKSKIRNLRAKINHKCQPNIYVTLVKRFCSAGHCITKMGLSNICTHDQDGTEYPDPIFPYKITFEPTGSVNFPEEKPASR